MPHTQDSAVMKAFPYYKNNRNPCHFQRRILRCRHLDLAGFNNEGTIHEYEEISIQPVAFDRVRLYVRYFRILLKYLDAELGTRQYPIQLFLSNT